MGSWQDLLVPRCQAGRGCDAMVSVTIRDSGPHASPRCQDTTKNYSRQEAAEQLRTLLDLPWTSASLQTAQGPNLSVQVTRKGRVLVQRAAPEVAPGPVAAAAHDRRKALLIPGDVPDPFLKKIGLQTEDGRIRANMQVGDSSAAGRLQSHRVTQVPRG